MIHDRYGKILASACRAGRVLPLLATCWLLGTAVAAHAQVLTPLADSPFGFTSPPAGQNSNVALLSPNETLLFVSNQYSNTITVFNVAADGTLSFQGAYVTTPSLHATGIALNPAGNRLYVTTYDDTVNVHSVAADGSLAQVQAAPLGTPSSAENGIVYVSLAGGDFVYVNNNEVPNTVTAFRVLADGTVSSGAVVATNGNGDPLGFFAAPRLLVGSDRRLYVLNESSSTISVFDIDPATGNLAPVAGSPFALPADSDSSGALAISADSANLYAGTRGGDVVKYQIDPLTGALSGAQVGFTGLTDDIDGLVVDPSGAFLAGVLFLDKNIAVLDTATMTPVPNSPFGEDVTAPTSYAAGILFNGAGTRVFTGDANSSATQASVYNFGP